MGYKLYYFNMRAAGEPIRLVLAAAQVPFEDFRFEREDWPKYKYTIPWGKVPALKLDDGQFVCQSGAIVRYLARKYGLVGETELEAAKCDELAGVVTDFQQEVAKTFHAPTDEAKEEAKKKLLEETYPEYYKNFVEIIKKNGTGYIVGKKLTYADILVAFINEQVQVIIEPKLWDKYPEMGKYVKFIDSQPGIKEWIAKRPVTPF